MLQRFVPRDISSRVLLGLALLGCLAWIAQVFFRRPAAHPDRAGTPANAAPALVSSASAPRNFQGDVARAYFEKTSEGQSLMKAIEVQQYGLKRQAQSPFDKASGAGHLGMSHDENLNVWFGDESATIRPTLSDKDRYKVWRLEMKLKAYGYGNQLHAAPPIVSRSVKDNRLEYVRDTAANPHSKQVGRLCWKITNRPWRQTSCNDRASLRHSQLR